MNAMFFISIVIGSFWDILETWFGDTDCGHSSQCKGFIHMLGFIRF